MSNFALPTFPALAAPMSALTFHVVPFLYLYISTWFYRLFLYPLIFVAPWVMAAWRRDQYSFNILYLSVPFSGCVFLLICIRFLFQKGQPNNLSHHIQCTLFIFLLTFLSDFTPLVPFRSSSGALFDYSFVKLGIEQSFGYKFYTDFDFENLFEFLTGAVGMPVLVNVWAACMVCSAVGVVRCGYWWLKKEKE